MGILLWGEMHFLISWNLQTNTRETHTQYFSKHERHKKISFPDFEHQVHPAAYMVHKGINPVIDSYSAFFDNKKLSCTDMEEHLRGKGITDIYVCGIAYDVCVGASHPSSVWGRWTRSLSISCCSVRTC